FLLSLGTTSERVVTAINGVRAPQIVVTRPPAPAPVPRLAKFLEPEIREGLVTVTDQDERSIITLAGDGIFDPGSIVVKERYVPVLDRIAAALGQVSGPVLVTGHTDNQRIHTARFPSNWHLSQARADVVKALLERRLVTPNRVRAEGRADAEPVAAN